MNDLTQEEITGMTICNTTWMPYTA